MEVYPSIDTELHYRTTAYHREFRIKIGVDTLPDCITTEISFLKSYLADIHYVFGMIYNEIDVYLPFDLDYLGSNWLR